MRGGEVVKHRGFISLQPRVRIPPPLPDLMSPEKIKKYIEQTHRALFYYHHTSCSISQIARHLEISHGKVLNMISGTYPKSVKKYLFERKNGTKESDHASE